MTRRYLSLGSNLGDTKANLDAAVTAIAALPGVRLIARSSYYRSPPDGPVQDQPDFVNIAIAVETEIGPAALAAACRAIETKLGRDRTREISWGPRPIDIDVLGEPLDERAFVLLPLAEIAPDAVFAGASVASRRVEAGAVSRLDWPIPV